MRRVRNCHLCDRTARTSHFSLLSHLRHPPHLYSRRPRTSAAEVDAGIVNGLPGTNCFTAVLVPSTKDRIDAVILRRALSWTDRLIPNAETFAIARDLKRAETRVIEQVGHVSSIQAPERVAEAVIAFLNS